MDGNTVETLQTVFTSRLFRVPDYQRGYANECYANIGGGKRPQCLMIEL